MSESSIAQLVEGQTRDQEVMGLTPTISPVLLLTNALPKLFLCCKAKM